MNSPIRRFLIIPVFALLLGAMATTGAKAEVLTLEEKAASTLEALEILKRSAEFLAQTKEYGVTVEIGYDVVQESGQKIEFGGRRKLTIRRPDHARVDYVSRNGQQASVYYNGESISVFNEEENAYAQVMRPGGIGPAFQYLSEEFDVPMPLRDFLAGNSAEILTDGIESAAYVEESVIADKRYDHLAFRNDQVDFQVWVAQGDAPLPKRVVISYRHARGQPQFWAQFLEWDLSPKVSDSHFEFEPPEGAEKIPFLAVVQSSEAGGEAQ